MNIKVGTRGSKLAVTQTKKVMEDLKCIHKDLEYEIIIIKTTGDKIQDVSLDKLGEKGIFVKEIEEALLAKKIDLAVHSMKDMPGKQPEGLFFSAVPKREDPRDVLIMNHGYKTLDDLPIGAKIGTGSKRRSYQLLKLREDLQIMPIRGNVETRIKKMKENDYDGIIMAKAGLNRLGLTSELRGTLYEFDTDKMIPSPAQGALGLEIRSDDLTLHDILMSLEDKESRIQIEAERGFLIETKGGCHVPIGACCSVEGGKLTLECIFGKEDGSRLVRKNITGEIQDAFKLGVDLAIQVKKELEI
ncbi:hydroxymethylbilane synthase [Alkalibacter mobilis]|uniref:hydroxymethylbilane synthase n=1 Tax=Alkalibacter mobilis TaxID=2787712 RepID=UPI00189DB64C|nr:hydroxymethylbilane synthase [Alkalibacter mobilis]MBF7097165.1 hydroxymethylbilane synthase [Alkalibacter mobilis]